MEFYIDCNGNKVFKHDFWATLAEEEAGISPDDHQALESFMKSKLMAKSC